MMSLYRLIDVTDTINSLNNNIIILLSMLTLLSKHIILYRLSLQILTSMGMEPFESTTGDCGSIVALTEVENEHFPRIRDWITEFLCRYDTQDTHDASVPPVSVTIQYIYTAYTMQYTCIYNIIL